LERTRNHSLYNFDIRYQILAVQPNKKGIEGRGMGEMFNHWWKNLKGRDNLVDISADGIII
jgi:hypothetical protein